MTTQPEALRLADWARSYKTNMHNRCAAELRRLHAENAELLEALKYIDKEFRKHGRQHWPEAVKARAAIAKAGGTE
jgi:hypothetical protein